MPRSPSTSGASRECERSLWVTPTSSPPPCSGRRSAPRRGSRSARGITPLEISFWRAAIAGLLFALHAGARGRMRVARRDLPAVGGFALFGVTIFYWSYFRAVELGGAALAAILLYTAPAWVALAAALWLGERLTVRKSIAVALTLAGIALVALGSGSGAVGRRGGSDVARAGVRVGTALGSRLRGLLSVRQAVLRALRGIDAVRVCAAARRGAAAASGEVRAEIRDGVERAGLPRRRADVRRVSALQLRSRADRGDARRDRGDARAGGGRRARVRRVGRGAARHRLRGRGARAGAACWSWRPSAWRERRWRRRTRGRRRSPELSALAPERDRSSAVASRPPFGRMPRPAS